MGAADTVQSTRQNNITYAYYTMLLANKHRLPPLTCYAFYSKRNEMAPTNHLSMFKQIFLLSSAVEDCPVVTKRYVSEKIFEMISDEVSVCDELKPKQY